MNILLIDDNEDDMCHFCDELRLDGHVVEHAHDLKELNSVILSNVIFDCMILDLMFPPEDGVPLAESDFGYRAGQFMYESILTLHYNNVPFVMLSAMDKSITMYGQVEESLSRYASFRGIVRKPVDVDYLLTLFA